MVVTDDDDDDEDINAFIDDEGEDDQPRASSNMLGQNMNFRPSVQEPTQATKAKTSKKRGGRKVVDSVDEVKEDLESEDADAGNEVRNSAQRSSQYEDSATGIRKVTEAPNYTV